MTRPRVVVVGDLAMDVLVSPTGPAVVGGEVPARIRTAPGGAAANTAAWLAHLGADVTLVARIGNDRAGRDAADGVAAAGVRPRLTVDRDAPTCTVVVLTGDGDRTMYSERGAAARLAVDDVPPLDGADHLHLSGYVLLDPASRPAGLAALDGARAAALSTSVDPGALLRPALLPDLRGVDLLLPNAAELGALGGSAAGLLDLVGAVVTTRGMDGATWDDPRGHWEVAAPPVDVRDPTGAGDAFDAGLLIAWLGGAEPVDALRAGCAAGAAAARVVGARPG